MYGTAMNSEYANSQEKKDDEFAFDYKEMIEELEKRDLEGKDANLQADELRAQLFYDQGRKHKR